MRRQADNGGVSLVWLDRNPREFVRMRKTMSEPALRGANSGKLPKIGKGASAGAEAEEKPRRKGATATEIIAAQEKEDAEKEKKDLYNAGQRAERLRQEHCMLVNERGLKERQHQKASEKLEVALGEAAAKAMELEVLKARFAMLEEEMHELEHELQLEVDTTPRYEHMQKRTQKASLEAADRCAVPQRELERVLGQLRRKGMSHATAQLEAESIMHAAARMEKDFDKRAAHREADISTLRKEYTEKLSAQQVVRDMMIKKQIDAFKAAGDEDTDKERELLAAAARTTTGSVATHVEKTYTREKIAEIERAYAKLAATFACEETDELTRKVIRMMSGSESEKVEELHAQADVFKARGERLREEVLQQRRLLETLRYEGEGSSPGYLILTPRGEGVIDCGGDEEVVAMGGKLKGIAAWAGAAAERHRHLEGLLTGVSVALSGLLGTTKIIPEPKDAEPGTLELVQGSTIPMLATDEALRHVEARLLSTTGGFELVKDRPHLMQPPEMLNAAAEAAVQAYINKEALHVQTWSVGGSSKASQVQTPRAAAADPALPPGGDGAASSASIEVGDDAQTMMGGVPMMMDGTPAGAGFEELAPAPGLPPAPSAPSMFGRGTPSPPLPGGAADGLSMLSLPKARPAKGAKRPAAAAAPAAASTASFLPPLTPFAPAAAPPIDSLFAVDGSEGGFGSPMHLSHVSSLQLALGSRGGNNVRIPLDEASSQGDEAEGAPASRDWARAEREEQDDLRRVRREVLGGVEAGTPPAGAGRRGGRGSKRGSPKRSR